MVDRRAALASGAHLVSLERRERERETGGCSRPPHRTSPRYLHLVRLKADPLVRFYGSRDWLDTGCAAQSLAAARTIPPVTNHPLLFLEAIKYA